MEALNKEIKNKILSYLESNGEASSSEISKKISHNRVTVTKYLEMMRLKGLLENRIVAQAKLWKLVKSEKPKILVADDEPHVVNLIRISLLHEFNVREAYSGIEALETAYIEKPDLIVLDLMMPGINGYEVCRRLKEKSATKDIAILILSAKGELDDKIKAMNLEADDYMTKPFDPIELASRIKMILNRNKNNNIDSVTKLPNHSGFSDYVAKNKRKLNGFILTLKNFQEFSKEKGYKKSEEILKLTSSLITQRIKEKDFLAHIKTDSFAIICNRDIKKDFAELSEEFDKMLPYFYGPERIKGKKLSLAISQLKQSSI